MRYADTVRKGSTGAVEVRNSGGTFRRILRSIGAVLAGLLATVILSLGTDVVLRAAGIFPPWLKPMSSALFVLATAYRTVFGVAGGYVTAGLAAERPMQHALALGVIGFVFSMVGAVATWNSGPEFEPKWYPISLIVVSVPSAWAGAKLRVTRLRARRNRK